MVEDLTNVYDLLHPSPPSLKQLVSISVALEIWRHEINEYRVTNTLTELEFEKEILPTALKPLLPSTLFSDIEEYTKIVGKSIDHWLEDSCGALLDFHRDDANEILRDFDDFVCDFDGGIHLGRTAKRMMLSDRFSIDEKFKIAGTHCLEDDIVRMWPSVKTKVNLDGVDFHKHAILYYWICRLTNQLEKIPGFYSGSGRTVEEAMFRYSSGCTWSWTSVNYLWNRLNLVDRWRSAIDLYEKNERIFSRYVLAKLKEEEIDKLMAERDGELFSPLLSPFSDNRCILPTWALIKAKLSVHRFLIIARTIFERETTGGYATVKYDSRKIWESAPNNLKQAVIQELLPDSSLFIRHFNNYIRMRCRSFSFLLAVLTDVSFEDRKAFWDKNWRYLISGCETEGLSSLLRLCFNNETEIVLVKGSTLSKYENIRPHCSKLLKGGHFQELKKFISFCCLTEQASRDVMLNVVMNDIKNLKVNFFHVACAEIFDDFIKFAFNNDENKIHNFKINLSLFDIDDPIIVEDFVGYGNFCWLMNFVDRFIVSNEKAVYLKKRLIPDIFTRNLTKGIFPDFEDGELTQFIQWCFENNERDIAEFKRTLPMDELVEKILRSEVSFLRTRSSGPRRRRGPRRSKNYSCMLYKLLKWYFVVPEVVEEWKTKCDELFELFYEEPIE